MSDGGRPPAVDRADVTVALDNEVLGTVRVDNGFKPYALPIPPALAERLEPRRPDDRTDDHHVGVEARSRARDLGRSRARRHGRPGHGKVEPQTTERNTDRVCETARTDVGLVLQIPDAGERALVRTADAALSVATTLVRPFTRRATAAEPQRILLLRLERIGDLVMALEAIRDVRSLAPNARIDLVVGSWNAELAQAVASVDRVETLDPHWLAREGEGVGMSALMRTAWGWRGRGYDLAINFEPDVRSNLVAAAAGAAKTAGWASGGGAPVLDVALDYDPSAHTTANARRLVQRVFGRTAPESTRPLLVVSDRANAAAAALLRPGFGRPLVGVHVSGGRAIKQWPPERFAQVAARLADERRRCDRRHRRPGRPDARIRPASRPRAAPRDRRLGGRGTARLGSAPRQARRAGDGRYRPHAPGISSRDAGRRRVRAIGPGALRDVRTPGPRRSHRPSVQPVQPHPPSPRAVRRSHSGLPRRHHVGRGIRRGEQRARPLGRPPGPCDGA